MLAQQSGLIKGGPGWGEGWGIVGSGCQEVGGSRGQGHMGAELWGLLREALLWHFWPNEC